MNTKRWMWHGVVVSVFCMALSFGAATDASAAAFIKFDGIDGEAQDEDHKGWIDVQSFQQTVKAVREGANETTRRRRVELDDMVIHKELDKSSPKLAESLVRGQVFPVVTIRLTRSFGERQQIYYVYELKNVIVTSYSISGAGQSDEAPVEKFSLNFEEIKVTYTELDETGAPKGNVEYTWKVEEGES